MISDADIAELERLLVLHHELVTERDTLNAEHHDPATDPRRKFDIWRRLTEITGHFDERGQLAGIDDSMAEVLIVNIDDVIKALKEKRG